MINLKRYLIQRIEDFLDNGYVISHIGEMNILTVDAIMYMTFDSYIKQPMPAVERRLDFIFARNPNLINSHNRFHIDPLIRK